MIEQEPINNSSFYYSISLLRMLYGMGLLSNDEYGRICKISANYYNSKIICV